MTTVNRFGPQPVVGPLAAVDSRLCGHDALDPVSDHGCGDTGHGTRTGIVLPTETERTVDRPTV